MKKIINKKGITLIETIIYLGLFALIFTSVIQFVLAINEYQDSASEKANLERSTIFLAEHLNDTFQKASSVDVPNTNFGIDNGKIRLSYPDGTFREYAIVNERLVFLENNINYDLTKSQYDITKFNLESVTSQTGEVLGVKTTITIVYNKDSKINRTIETLFKIK